MGETPSKADILQSFLDVSKLCMELFDAVEGGSLVVDPRLLQRMAGVIRALSLAHQALVWEYANSGRAADDLLRRVRADLARGGDHGTTD